MKRFAFFLFNIFAIFGASRALEKEITINIDAGKIDCFFQEVKQGETIDIEYQVIDGGHGDLDITFHVFHPTSRVLLHDFKKSENNHRFEATDSGDYKFCFDNTFSSFNSKTVFFELIVERDDEEWGSDENAANDLSAEELYEVKVQDIHEVIGRVRTHLTKARHLQDGFKSFEARDRNVAEENFFKVNWFSFMQSAIMVFVGFIQVVMVKSLFDNTSKVHKLWKKMDFKS